ncbi:hypothetical protein, partial [Listeria monocytogenes]
MAGVRHRFRIYRETLSRFSCAASMFVLFARRFEKNAFNKLRSEGVLAITIANAFGNKVDESLARLSKVIQGTLSIERHPDELLQMVKDLESISGENGNLRGY